MSTFTLRQRWSRIPLGSALCADGGGELYFKSNGVWRSVRKITGISRQEIMSRHRQAFGSYRVPSQWVFDDLVKSTSDHPSGPETGQGESTSEAKTLPGGRLPRPLSKSAVERANEYLWETCTKSRGRWLTMKRKDLASRRIWAAAYRRFVGVQMRPAISSSPAPQPPPPLAEKQEQDIREVPCSHEGLIVSCSHSNRGYQLTVPPSATDRTGGSKVFEVVAGAKERPDEITISTLLAEGPCSRHKNLVGSSSKQTKSLSTTRVVIDAFAHLDYTRENVFGNPFKYICPFPAKQQYISAWSQSCDRSASQNATILIYPDIRWTAKLGIGIETSRSASYDSHTAKRSSATSFKFSGSLDLHVDGKTESVKADFENYVSTVLKAVNATNDMAEYMSKNLDNIGGFKIEILCPWLEISGSWGYYEEIKSSYRAGPGYDILLDFNPLIGIEGEANILQAILNATGVGGIIAGVLRRGVDIGIWLGAQGKIGGKLAGIKKVYAATPQNPQGGNEVTGEILFKLEARIEAEIDVVIIKVGATLKVGAKSAIKGTLTDGSDDVGPFAKGKIEWTGLTVYLVIHIYADGKRMSFKKKSSGGRFSKEKSSGGRFSGQHEKRKEVYWTAIKPREWPFEKHYFLENSN